MSKRVERKYIDAWISEHCPNGLLRLAEISEVSADTIVKVRLGYVPRKKGTRDRLCRALNISEAKLFPAVSAAGEQAS